MYQFTVTYSVSRGRNYRAEIEVIQCDQGLPVEVLDDGKPVKILMSNSVTELKMAVGQEIRNAQSRVEQIRAMAQELPGDELHSI